MKNTRTIFGTYFCGNEISDYGKQNGFVDYATLAKSFDAVMCNDILSTTAEIGYWDQVNGSDVIYEDSDGNILDYEEYTDKLEELQERLEDAEAEDNLELISELENEINDLENSERYSEIFQYFIIFIIFFSHTISTVLTHTYSMSISFCCYNIIIIIIFFYFKISRT